VTERAPLRKAGDADVHPAQTEPLEPLYRRAGATTADAIAGPGGDKLVDLGVRVPKSLRRAIRQEAKRRDVTVDDLVARILRDRDPT
jgi:hypothetical protein